MGFRDLREVFDPDLYLTIGGKQYRIPAATMEQAERLKELVLAEVTEAQELAEIEELLGPVHDELLADGVKWPEYLHLGRTALLWAGAGDKAAEGHWHFAQLGQLVDLEKLRAMTREKAPAKAPTKRAPRKRAPRKKAG
jgi:hypothetical protein